MAKLKVYVYNDKSEHIQGVVVGKSTTDANSFAKDDLGHLYKKNKLKMVGSDSDTFEYHNAPKKWGYTDFTV